MRWLQGLWKGTVSLLRNILGIGKERAGRRERERKQGSKQSRSNKRRARLSKENRGAKEWEAVSNVGLSFSFKELNERVDRMTAKVDEIQAWIERDRAESERFSQESERVLNECQNSMAFSRIQTEIVLQEKEEQIRAIVSQSSTRVDAYRTESAAVLCSSEGRVRELFAAGRSVGRERMDELGSQAKEFAVEARESEAGRIASEEVSRKRKEKGKKLKDRIEALIEKFDREGAERAEEAEQKKAKFEAWLERFTREAGERERLASERRAEEAEQKKARFEASLERFTREAGERERLASERRAEEAQQEKAKFEASLERFTREAGERERLASERRAEEAEQEKARFEAWLERFTREAEEERKASETRWAEEEKASETRWAEEEKASEARWAERARGLEALAQQQLEEIKQVFAKQHEQLLLSFDTERSKQSALINQQAQRIDVLTERLAAADRIFSALDEKLSDEPVSERLEEKSGVQAEARAEGSDEGLGDESIYNPRFFGSTGKNAAEDCVRVVVKEPEGEEKETVVEGVVAREENSARTLESELGVMGEAGSGPEAIELVTVREGCSRF